MASMTTAEICSLWSASCLLPSQRSLKPQPTFVHMCSFIPLLYSWPEREIRVEKWKGQQFFSVVALHLNTYMHTHRAFFPLTLHCPSARHYVFPQNLLLVSLLICFSKILSPLESETFTDLFYDINCFVIYSYSKVLYKYS